MTPIFRLLAASARTAAALEKFKDAWDAAWEEEDWEEEDDGRE